MKVVADWKFHVLFHMRQFTGIIIMRGRDAVGAIVMMDECPFLMVLVLFGPNGILLNLVFMMRILVVRPWSRGEIPYVSRGVDIVWWWYCSGRVIVVVVVVGG